MLGHDKACPSPYLIDRAAICLNRSQKFRNWKKNGAVSPVRSGRISNPERDLSVMDRIYAVYNNKNAKQRAPRDILLLQPPGNKTD